VSTETEVKMGAWAGFELPPLDGTVDEVTVAVGDQVASAQLLVTFDTGTSDTGTSETGTSDNEESTP